MSEQTKSKIIHAAETMVVTFIAGYIVLGTVFIAVLYFIAN